MGNPEPPPRRWLRGIARAAGRSAAAVAIIAAVVAVTPEIAVAKFTTAPTAPAPTITSDPYFTCATAIPASNPWTWYKLAESKGTTATDSSSNANTGTYQGTVTYGVAGPCPRDLSTAVTLDGSSGYVTSNATAAAPTVFTEEVWFKTTTTSGGKLIGFGTSQTGASSQYDRHIYMENSGQLVFGVYPGSCVIITSPASYNDGKWHLVDASLSSAGMVLYVDGQAVATGTNTSAQSFSSNAYLRVGYDNLNAWPSGTVPTSYYFGGSLAQVAVYTGTALTATQVANHYGAGTPTLAR